MGDKLAWEIRLVIWIKCSVAADENCGRIGNDASSNVNPGVYSDVTGDSENCFFFCGVI